MLRPRPARRSVRRIAGDRRGATAVEFALIATPLFMVLLALIDLGYREYMSVILQGTLDQAARKVTVGGVSSSTIDTFVRTRIASLSKRATVTINRSSYFSFTNVGKPEPITTDTAPLGVYNAGDCYQDINGNQKWDADAGRSGTGGSDDIVYYSATVSFPAASPMRKLIGWSQTETVSATTMLRNQPYASQPDPAIRCS